MIISNCDDVFRRVSIDFCTGVNVTTSQEAVLIPKS